jgi:hypothetical protein
VVSVGPKLLTQIPPKTPPPNQCARCLTFRQPIRCAVYPHVLKRQRRAARKLLFVVDNARAVVTSSLASWSNPTPKQIPHPPILTLLVYQSGAVVRSMIDINIEPPADPFLMIVIERATLFDSVGFHRGLQFPPTLHYKSPNIVYRANNVLVDAQTTFQYFYINTTLTCTIA